MITAEQLKDIKERTEALNRYLDIEGKKIQVEEEQLRTQAPGFWDDQKAAEAQMKKVKGLQQWISGYNEVKVMADELQLAFDFYKDELVTEEEVDEAAFWSSQNPGACVRNCSSSTCIFFPSMSR